MSSLFNVSSLKSLAERTEYESWFLEAVYELVDNRLFPSWPDAVIYPLGKKKAHFIVFGRLSINLFSSDWRPGFLSVGAPLVFISTFKLLDMLIEWILRENGNSSTFRFQEKLKQLNSSLIYPSAIESRTWLKERLTGLYTTLEPLRGTIIHDKHFTATDGAVRVASSKKGVIGAPVEITAAHLRLLARTIISVLRYVDGTWHFNNFSEKVLRHDLDELAALHGLPLLGQKAPLHTCVRVFSIDPDPLNTNPIEIAKDLAAHYANQDCSFDLRVLIVKDREVIDAYFFPWAILDSPKADWRHCINAEEYRSTIPSDVNPDHLGHE